MQLILLGREHGSISPHLSLHGEDRCLYYDLDNGSFYRFAGFAGFDYGETGREYLVGEGKITIVSLEEAEAWMKEQAIAGDAGLSPAYRDRTFRVTHLGAQLFDLQAGVYEMGERTQDLHGNKSPLKMLRS